MDPDRRSSLAQGAVGAFILAGLLLAARANYLLFHGLAELLSVAVASGIFMVAWNARRLLASHYLLFIGIAYLFVGGLDLMHALTYEGMGVLPGLGADPPTQLWIAARWLQGLSLLAAPLFFRRSLRPGWTVAGYAAATALLLLAIFAWGIFPASFVTGRGLTPFKKASEYLISLVLLASIGLLLANRRELDRRVLRLMVGSLALTVASELTFTFYSSVYDLLNLAGHVLKILAFFLVYKAIVETGLSRPYQLLFHQLKRSEEHYRSLFDQMIDGFAYHRILLDDRGAPADYEFLEANAAFERFTGLSRQELIGRRVTEVLPGILQDAVDWIGTYGRVALTGEPARFESRSEALGRWYSVLAYSPERGFFATVFEDITERRRTAEELRQAKEAAETAQKDAETAQEAAETAQKDAETAQEAAEAARTEAEAARLEAEQASRAKSEFLAHMSHEIRTPLSAIIGLSEVLSPRLVEEEPRQFVSMIRESARSLLAIIGDILDLSRAESGRVEVRREPFDLAAQVEAVAAPLRVIAGEKGLRLEVEVRRDVPRHVNGDPDLLGQVLRNLLSNAVKFTARGLVRLEVRRAGAGEGTGAGLLFEVSDTGIGIPADRQAGLFQSFSRLHGTVRDGAPEGTGLGLAITRRLVELMGGRIGVESREGEGSTFGVVLPLEEAAPSASSAAEAAERAIGRLAQLPPMHVLVVEDNPAGRLFLQRALGDAGHRVSTAENGEQAVARVGEQAAGGAPFDLVLMDIQMPVLDGIEAARRIRRLPPPAARVPIIALTAFAVKGDRQRFLAAGLDGYVSKPIRFDRLAAAIHRARAAQPLAPPA